jgi:uncharacterized protein (TIRG00374 family)
LAAIGVGTFLPDASLFVGAVLFCTAAGLVVMASERLSSLLTRALSALPVIGRFSARIEELMMALRTCLAPVPLAITVAASLVAWWAECLGYWLVFQGMDVAAPLDTATFLYAWSTVFGAPAPGGIGLADATLSGGALQFIPGLSDGGAVASSLIIRVATLWFGVVLGAIALLRMESVVQRALKG